MTRLIGWLTLAALPVLSGGELSGRRAPSFSLPDSKFVYHDILDHRGKVLLLDIMQTACPHCSVLSMTLEKVKSKYGDKISVISIVNNPDNQTTVAQYVAKHKVTSPVLFDCGYTTGAYLKKASFDVPHLFVIDQQGTIREDFEYSAAQKAIFEGTGLFPIIDKLLAAK